MVHFRNALLDRHGKMERFELRQLADIRVRLRQLVAREGMV